MEWTNERNLYRLRRGKGPYRQKPKMLEDENTMARDETLSFQVVYKLEWPQKEIEVKIKSPIKNT